LRRRVPLTQQAQYQGSAEVLLQQQDLSNSLTGVPPFNNVPADRAAQTQANLARVPTVARRAIEAAGVRMDTDDFLASSTVAAGTNSDILTFNVTNSSHRLAGLLGTAYARFVRSLPAQVGHCADQGSAGGGRATDREPS
jgi:hypothetical protein